MKKILSLAVVSAVLLAGCGDSQSQSPAPAAAPDAMDFNIAELAQVVESPQVAVRGFGIVAGLFGSGSSECPVELRQELEKYIWQQVPEAGAISPKKFIESLDTAVVEVLGVIPAMANTGQSFDVLVRPLAQTQTTSLSGGFLYTTDLKEMSRFTQFNQFAKTVARAQGQIFTDRNAAAGQPSWYVLGGGYPISDVNISLILNKPDFLASGAIRNRINERFGPKTANAISAGEVLIVIPETYRKEKNRYLDLIRRLYLTEQSDLKAKRIASLIEELKAAPDKYSAEVSLEAIGRTALDDLAVLLKSDDPAVRFHAARCMANIGDSRPLDVLRELVFDPQSPYRADAMRSIGQRFKRDDTDPIFLRALGLDDIEMRIVAYETALAAKSVHIKRMLVAGDFFVDRVLCGGSRVVYAMRKERPGIVIFGSPVRASDNVFMKSDDGQVTINARSGDKYMAISRNHPGRPRVVGPLSSGYELTQIIRAMGESPEVKQGSMAMPGLALSYSQIVEIIEKMCKNGVLDAAFYQSDLSDAANVLTPLQNSNQ